MFNLDGMRKSPEFINNGIIYTYNASLINNYSIFINNNIIYVYDKSYIFPFSTFPFSTFTNNANIYLGTQDCGIGYLGGLITGNGNIENICP